ncbi:hypothetical protein Emed_002152 [Eimeria media]
MVQVPLSLALVCIGSASWGVYTPQVEALGTPQQQAAFLGPLSSAWSGPQQQSVFCSRQQQQQQQQQLAAARRPFVGGNWKCNGTIQGAEDIVKMLNDAPPEVDDVEASQGTKTCGCRFADAVDECTSSCQPQSFSDGAVQCVVVAPPSLHAGFVLRSLRRPFGVGLQDSSTVKGFGAYTGELSPQMLKDFGIKSVIVGHSERRAGFNNQPKESNEVVAAKAKNAVDAGLQVIACIAVLHVGGAPEDSESLEERQSGRTMEVLGEQLRAYSAALSASDWAHVVLAYEPIWAIGTGQTATPEVAQNTHQEIRKWLRQHVSDAAAEEDLFAQPDIDGFLVGGASLTADFHAILKGAQNNKTSP